VGTIDHCFAPGPAVALTSCPDEAEEGVDGSVAEEEMGDGVAGAGAGPRSAK
jgi:hypothetical protein